MKWYITFRQPEDQSSTIWAFLGNNPPPAINVAAQRCCFRSIMKYDETMWTLHEVTLSSLCIADSSGLRSSVSRVCCRRGV